MNAATCTLFEGHYHFGLASLANSLYQNGYRGTLYAGYRGALPSWAKNTKPVDFGKWNGAESIEIASDFRLTFLPLSTDSHLTNYKPEFMLGVMDALTNSAAESLFYFDPDICVNKEWRYFEQWVDCGIALCEDVNSPLPQNHPRRVGWRRYFDGLNISLTFKEAHYVNGGFVGVTVQMRDFLKLWLKVMHAIGDHIGGLQTAKVERGESFSHKGFWDCFDASDQDALNVALEATDMAVSVIGKEAMAFKSGLAMMPHALGTPKPWKKRFITDAIKGHAPRLVDKLYLQYQSPICAHSAFSLCRMRCSCKIASAIGRIVRKS